ncbi:YjbE family putative metal transport protein [Xanthobacter aminoxidans]|uniref:YjbE family putative metal transport protein n=1 Tax=Xanthobacter aminoxidans TaxID=186280 RepID=UPI002022F96D|nr:YjbE family putative metal transport protein [Xanthobacter aminoxidans]MCL8382680.1 YjbE family putative metal transport protein [Xanthobacter aminoxidans]
MDLGADLSWFGTSLKIFLIDILLSGDNALLIALACRSLPAEQVRKAVMLGAAGAVFFRLVIAALAGTLMAIPLLKIGGGLLLAVISINLLAGEYRRRREGDREVELDPSLGQGGGLLGAALVILIADAIMSLDNVVALAAVSEGHLSYLVGGVLLSVPLIFFGSFVMAEAMKHIPALTFIGTAFLGWIAGSLIVTDPLWSGWVAANAEALFVLVPPAAAIFVLANARFTADARTAGDGKKQAPPPKRGRILPAGATPAPVAVAVPVSVAAPVIAAAAPVPAPMAIAAAASIRTAEPVLPAAPVAAVAEMPAAPPPARPAAPVRRPSQNLPPAPDYSDKVMIYGLIGLFGLVAVVMISVLIMAHGVG